MMETNGMILRVAGKKWGEKKCSHADSAEFLLEEMGWALEAKGIDITPMEWHQSATFDEMKEAFGHETSPVVALYNKKGEVAKVIGGFAEFDKFVASQLGHA
ncbi:hypothetical protein ACFL2U_01065 [Patescibacteria group bacterium]